jgi:hypothetical protein
VSNVSFQDRVTHFHPRGWSDATTSMVLLEVLRLGRMKIAMSWGYFKLYQSQIPVVEQAIETAAAMLGTDKSRGYCLEMICADFLAGASLDNEDPSLLLQSMSRFFKFLPCKQR